MKFIYELSNNAKDRCIQGPTAESLCIISVSGGRNVTFEGLFEGGKVRRRWGRQGQLDT